MSWLEALILGVVQGLTEFLPISSDGHLFLVRHFFDAATGRPSQGDQGLFFIVVLHLGTLAAILLHYRREIRSGARGLLGATDVPELYLRKPVIRTGLLVVLATSLLGPIVLVEGWIEQAGESLSVIGIGFWVTASILTITTSKLSGGDKGPAETTPLDAILIGLAQMFAPLPGVSRSGLTIAAALAVGFRRNWAVQFSLMLAVPAILGGNVMELLHRPTMSESMMIKAAVASVVAGIVGYAAIVWLVRVVRSGRLWVFSVYLVALGLVCIILGMTVVGRARSGEKATPPDRPARTGSAR